jgi:DNA-binding GntR family transcriptional regulator
MSKNGNAAHGTPLARRKHRRTRSLRRHNGEMPAPVIRLADSSGAERSRKEVAYEGLLNLLLSGELRPNDVIMERQLAQRLKVSRTPLREAMGRLEGEKLITRQNVGFSPLSLSTEDFLNILQVRRVLEGEAARRAAPYISRDELQQIRGKMVAVRHGTPSAGTDPNSLGRQLHLLIAQAASNPVLLSIIEDLGKRTRLFMRVPEHRSEVTDEHLAVIDALLIGDGEAARTAMEQHIDHLRVYILDKLSKI